MPMRMEFHLSGRVWWSCRPRALRGVSRLIFPLLCPDFCTAVEDDTIADFSLAIALRIIRRAELVGDLILSAEAGHLLAGKVCPVVGDNGVSEFKVTHNVLPKKFDNLFFSDFGEWHRLSPFEEVVSIYQEPQLRLCSGK